MPQLTQNQIIEEAKAEYNRSKDRLIKALDSTPDDKVGWSPAPTARTPIEIVTHCAISAQGMKEMLQSDFHNLMSGEEMDAGSRREEKQVQTREAAIALLEENSAAYLAHLDTLSDEQVASTLETPFGSFPMASAITFAADHNRSHAAQIDYIQTIYGDREWHF